MRLSELLAALSMTPGQLGPSGPSVALGGDPAVTGVTQDSRQVAPGHLFVAVRGGEADGHLYVGDALRRGAAAAVVERSDALPPGVPGAVVGDGRVALARLAAAYHGFPARRLRVVGVTGTDGKTTTASLILAILAAAGRPAGAITTVAARVAGEELDTGYHTTTPDAPAVQAYLARMVQAGAEFAVVETTSHGLDQGRTLDCDYDVAVVTNVTAEHLDYHRSFEAYAAAKAKLFEMLSTGYRKPGVAKVSVVNADDPVAASFGRYPADRRLSYGLDAPAEVRASRVELAAGGARFLAETPAGAVAVELPLPGRYNVANALAAIAVAVGQDLPLEAARRALVEFAGVPGRMEPVEAGQPFRAVVDFAHTPNALEKALTVARTLAPGRVIAVFGCAGLRDRTKRPAMGEIAGRLADLLVLTAEDPRTEDAATIAEEIAGGCRRAGRREGLDYWIVPDREEAIGHALGVARAGDVVLVTGKGHERSMCFGTTELPWSDAEAIRRQLGRLSGRPSR